MTKQETVKFLKTIKAHYPNFNLDITDADIVEEWYKELRPYLLPDVMEKFEEHLKGELCGKPPMVHFLTKYLKTPEEKEKLQNDYLIRCDLCGKEMLLFNEYENGHREKCLLIKNLIPILKANGDDATYELLDEYDLDTLNKVYDKYVPPENYIPKDKNRKEIFSRMFDNE